MAGTVLAAGTAYGVATITAPPATYEARAVILVGPGLAASDANSGQLDAARRVSQIYAQVALSRPLLQRVSDELDLGVTGESLVGQVTATTLVDSPIITIGAFAGGPEQAADIANEVVRQLVATSPTMEGEPGPSQDFVERQIEALEREIETLIPEVERLADLQFRTNEQDERLAGLQTRLTNLRSTYAALITASSPPANSLTIIEDAVPDPRPLPSGRGQSTIFAGLLGLFLAMAVALIVEHLDDTLKSSDDIERTSGLRNLGHILEGHASIMTHAGRATAQDARYPPIAEGFRSLKLNVEFSGSKQPRTLLITSGLRGEGKTTVAANLAIAFAESGRRVVLVDADLRRPALHRHFQLPNDRGLADLLQSTEPGSDDLTLPTGVAGLRVLPAGPDPVNLPELVGSARMQLLITTLRDSADVVIFDSPSVLAVADTSMLASMVDATLIVVDAGRTPAPSLRETRDALGRTTGVVMGTVLNRVPASWLKQQARTYPTPMRQRGRRRLEAEDRSSS